MTCCRVTVRPRTTTYRVITSPQGPPGPSAPLWFFQSFTPTNGQVTFLLSTAPLDSNSVVFEVNGVDYGQTDAFTISGQTITWLAPWAMETTDFVTVRYV